MGKVSEEQKRKEGRGAEKEESSKKCLTWNVAVIKRIGERGEEAVARGKGAI